MRIWMKCLALLGMLTPLVFGACGGVPSDPLLRFAGVKECNPITVFAPLGGIPAKPPSQTRSPVFVKNERAGCIGIYWKGQTGDPPYFNAVIKDDGSYLVYDPNTKQPVVGENKLGATVSPGVAEVDVVVCVMNIDSTKVLDLDCKNVVKGGAAACLNQPEGLYAWQGKAIPMDVSKGNGTCTLCHEEVCDGKDNNCNGLVDDKGACGTILGQSCQSFTGTDPTTDPKAPKCNSQEACQCLFVASTKEFFVCSGKTTGEVKWTKINAATATCTEAVSKSLDPNVNRAFCGSQTLLCERCESNPNRYFWRSTNGSCRDGQLRPPQ